MSKQRYFIAALAISLISTASYADADNDHDRALHLKEAGIILPLETILEKARKIRTGHVLEVELEEKQQELQYEIEILDEQGIVWELIFDPKTGELLKEEIEKEKED